MKIREVLDADLTVDKIDVTVRDKQTTKFIMRYCIGRDVQPGRSERFLYETELGDIEDFDTAYDVNKVVEQLEEHFNSTDDRNIRLAYHHAIEIVKAGGVNDKEYDQAAGN